MADFWENVSIYLPPYLSADSQDKLFEDVKKFVANGIGEEIYSDAFSESAAYVMQGDGIGGIFYVDLPDLTPRIANVMVCSNTCDISIENMKTRMNGAKVMYTPIISLNKYIELLKKRYTQDRIDAHIKAVREEKITQIMFLPKGSGLKEDSILFFDRMISLPLTSDFINDCVSKRLFVLSDSGFMLFLLKLSIHFTRIKEKLDRNLGIDVGAQEQQSK